MPQTDADPYDDWHVQYRDHDGDHVTMHRTPELAIKAACKLMDEGAEVNGIGTGPLTDSIDKAVIARIYAIWVGSKRFIKLDRTASAISARSMTM